MYKIEKQLVAGEYTILSLNQELPNNYGNTVEIDGKQYNTEIVYDLPKSIAVLGNGEFVGKQIIFA